jgi:hypothetical protein
MKKLITLVFCLTGLLGLHAQQLSFTTQIQASNDDAEEKFDGSYVTATSSDLELVYDTWNNQGLQTVGLRFSGVNIPQNAEITNAFIQFTADGTSSGSVTLNIQGENTGNSLPFAHGSSAGGNITNRQTTAETVTWTPPGWSNNQSGIAQRTPNLSAIVSTIIQNNGWEYGNPITFIITGTGSAGILRRAYSYDGSPTQAASLTIQYTATNPVDLSLTNINSPSSEIIFSNADSPLAVTIANVGTESVSEYQVSCFINNELHQTLDGNVSIPAGGTHTFEFSNNADFSEIGSYSLSFEVDVENDGNLNNNSISKTLQVVEGQSELFFTAGSFWKYWDQNTNPGLNWNQPDFDDSNWPIGAGKMGFGQSGITTNLEPNRLRYCFRKTVVIDNLEALNDKIFFHVMHDDGAVIFINGQEVFRTELMPLSSIGHTTSARQRINNDLQDQFITYTTDKSHFVEGENQISISVHNVSISDSDLSFNCFITPTHQYMQDGPYIFYDGDDIIVTEVTPNGLVTNTYSSIEDMEFTCYMPHWGEDKSFTFQVRPNLPIDPPTFPFTPEKFLVISDFDNHIEAFSMVLLGEGIMDEDFNWTYGNGHLIITGDLFDRGTNVTECLWLLYKLEVEALEAGGRVHLVIGNHEMMNLEDDWRYIEGKYFTNAQLMNKRMISFYDENTEIGRWLRTKNIILKLGDYALMHGGVSPQVANLNLSYQQMNDFGRARMNGGPCPGPCSTVTGSNGVYWYRGMANQELTQQQVDDICEYLDVNRVIFGHTKGTTVRSLYNGKVLAIDMFHMTNFANGFMEALQFEFGCFRIFNTTGTNTTYTQLGDCDDYFVGIQEIEDIGFKIFPNPSSNSINIILPQSISTNLKYTIVSSNGKTVEIGEFNNTENTLNVQHLAKGMYTIIMEGSQNTITGKFIIK